MDIAEEKRLARQVAAKRRAEAHAQLMETAGSSLALRGLPVVIGADQPLLFRAWTPGETLAPGVWDIPIPPETAAEVLPDVLLVPMLAFDRQGYRLGYGGGFYDRTLEKLRAFRRVWAVGVAYAAQEVEAVPRGDHDAPLDYVMTEQETFTCG